MNWLNAFIGLSLCLWVIVTVAWAVYGESTQAKRTSLKPTLIALTVLATISTFIAGSLS